MKVSIDGTSIDIAGEGINLSIALSSDVEVILPNGIMKIPRVVQVKEQPPPIPVVHTNELKPFEYTGNLNRNLFRSGYMKVMDENGTFKELQRLFPHTSEAALRFHVKVLKGILGKRFRPLRSVRG